MELAVEGLDAGAGKCGSGMLGPFNVRFPLDICTRVAMAPHRQTVTAKIIGLKSGENKSKPVKIRKF